MKKTNHQNNLSDFFDPWGDELTLDELVNNANWYLYQKDIKMYFYRIRNYHLHELVHNSDQPYAAFHMMRDQLLDSIDGIMFKLEAYEEYELCGKLMKKRKQYVKECDEYEGVIDRHTGINDLEWD